MSAQQLLAVEAAVAEDFVALLVARNRCGPAIPIEDLLHRNAIPLAEFHAMLASPGFVETVKRYIAELTAQGFGVESKAAVLHEAGLPIVYEILADRAQPALARLKAHEILGTVSGKGERPAPTTTINATGGTGAYQLVINLGPTTPVETLRASTSTAVEKLVLAETVDAAVTTELIDPDYAE